MVTYLHLEDAAPPLAQLFGKRLRERRVALKLTQGALVANTGVATSYVSLIERGRANPSLDILVALSQAVESTVSDMLRDEDSA